MSTDLSEAQPVCERCSNNYAHYHERTNLFLCVACYEAQEDDYPDDTRLEECATCLHTVVSYPCSHCGDTGEAEPADRGVSSFQRACLRQPLPLAVRLRDEAGPPLPQMVAQHRAALESQRGLQAPPPWPRNDREWAHQLINEGLTIPLKG